MTRQRQHDLPCLSLRLLARATRSLPGLALLMAGHAASAATVDELAPPSYRIAEQSIHGAEQQALSLSITALPDPASVLQPASRDAPESGQGYLYWYDQVAWITDIGTLLYGDQDHDGYFTGFSLTIDADTVHEVMEVYVTIELQRPLSLPERLHTSHDFSLYANRLIDEYRMDIDLVSRYPADLYDIIIELHDAYDDRVLDRVGAHDFRNLAWLPLESEELDYVEHTTDPVDVPLVPNDDIRVHEYAGSAGLPLAFLLGMALARRYFRRRERMGPKVEVQGRRLSTLIQHNLPAQLSSVRRIKPLYFPDRCAVQQVSCVWEDPRGDGRLPSRISTFTR